VATGLDIENVSVANARKPPEPSSSFRVACCRRADITASEIVREAAQRSYIIEGFAQTSRFLIQFCDAGMPVALRIIWA
jgi:hypothetical protein